ncbi:hypothetical protein IFVP5_C2280256 [Vibrio parahaemolyticus]|nr:putative membrane protein [Vibrio parahaemolyticus V-223/04]
MIEISKIYFLDILFLTTMAVVTQFLIIFPFKSGFNIIGLSIGK